MSQGIHAYDHLVLYLKRDTTYETDLIPLWGNILRLGDDESDLAFYTSLSNIGGIADRSIMRLVRTIFLFVISIASCAVTASGDNGGCHRWHSCPSTTGSFVCGDTGHCSQCPDNQYCKAGHPIGSSDNSQPSVNTTPGAVPSPLLTKGHSVEWWFVFKLNAKVFPGCGVGSNEHACPFGGTEQPYQYGQQFVYASSENASLQKGGGCAGDTVTDPLGSTFDEVYNGSLYYVVWNDQFYGDPAIHGCGDSCGAPWGHSKGMLAWDDSGNGLVLQVTTPSWPASGSKNAPRETDGNTLGCVKDDNVKVSQHFFALRLTKDDVTKVLEALQNASVVTDPDSRQIVHNGGPHEIQSLVNDLGTKSHSSKVQIYMLSSGVELISKPSDLNVPPWQLVSATLGGVPLRVASWWAAPKISSTTVNTHIACWSTDLGSPGPVDIATSGEWGGRTFSLEGGASAGHNHAKIGVSTSGSHNYAIFGDMNQQGALSDGYDYATQKCSSSQNGRGGLFYVIDDANLNKTIAHLIQGDTAPIREH